MIAREKELDTSGRMARAVVFSFTIHAGMLGVLIFHSSFFTRPPVITPGQAVFITPVSPPEKPIKKPEPPKPEPPRVKKSKAPTLRKKTAHGKIVPIGKKKKPPKPPPPVIKPEPVKPTIKPTPRKPSTFRTEGTEFKYDYYIRIVKRKVEENWITHGLDTSGQKTNPEVYFKISKRGDVLETQLEKSSGNAQLDESALEAVRRTKFPPLPPGYRRDYLGVYYNFEYAQRD
ncbi:MAG: TonB C-terminal domain-containing protein [Nitrospinota bacterium]|nr:TonB C-terminal domain-containing protein [Nitrospinota bacterium]